MSPPNLPEIRSRKQQRRRDSVRRRLVRFSARIAVAFGTLVGASEFAAAQDGLAAPTPPVVLDAAPRSLPEIEAAALAKNPTIAQLQAQVAAAEARWLQVGLPANPQIGYSGQQVGSKGLAEQDGVVVQMELVRLRKLRLNRAVASEEIALAEQHLAAQEMRVLTDARIGFYDVLAAQRRTELNEELVAISRQAVQTAERLLNAKEVSRVDLLQAKVDADQARILLANARQRARAAWRNLAAVIGEPEAEPVKLEGDLLGFTKAYEWDECLARLLSASPEIAAAAVNIDRADQALARARVENAPNLTVQGIVQHDNSLNAYNGAIQVTFPIPVLNRNQGNIRAAEHELFAAEQNLLRTELNLQKRLAPVFERYAAAREQAERYANDILPNAKESLELSQAAYRAGEVGFLPLLTAQRTFSETNLAYVEALRELWSASLEIDGLLLTGSLDDR